MLDMKEPGYGSVLASKAGSGSGSGLRPKRIRNTFVRAISLIKTNPDHGQFKTTVEPNQNSGQT